MAKSLRSSSRKTNNQRLKSNVFGPAESARLERLSAKLMELASQPKPQKDTEMKADDLESNDGDDSKQVEEATEMDVDGAANKAEVRRTAKKLLKLKKRRKSSIVFPKYGDRKVKGRK
ncbi:hypothetical protein SAPIO_CDS2994 [Scedosporium apiospermum]|uniref:DUF2423 domain-containing protein n=1 Tax=Pseudallescheria apiosperma TaxID=563466 RepID=A0A084GC02_PSEDA|nr:uncharacterized protein SAPIO_CDS2994 [Scedosporium apiospermum]KEZ44864.1 hypothetical protein SAPIO_CDS2994 [Scedosporium apiospermum]